MAALVGLALVAQVCLGFDVCAPPTAAPDDPATVVEPDDPTPAPEPACDLPVCGPLGSRLFCIEGYESGHFGGAVNPTSGARGYLQWLPSTARQRGVIIGNRYSEWSAAASIASLGEAFFRSQWVPLQRGLC